MFRYVDEAATLCPEIIPSIYNEAKTIRSNTEDPFYFSARFFDKIIGKNYEESELDGRGEIIFHVISQYVRSLMHGCCHLHQSLARLLTVRRKNLSIAHGPIERSLHISQKLKMAEIKNVEK